MPVQVQVTPIPPVEVIGITQAAEQVQVRPIPLVELVLKTDTSGNVSEWVVNETPIGAINGSNAAFTTSYNFVAGTVLVYLNGQRLKQIEDFNTSGSTNILLVNSPGVGEVVLVDYQKLN